MLISKVELMCCDGRGYRDGMGGKRERLTRRGLQGDEHGNRKQKIDILVNAAGITHFSPLIVTSEELLEGVMQTNLMGTMWGCRVVGKEMVRARSG